MEITGAEREIDDISDSGSKNKRIFFKEVVGIGSDRLLLMTNGEDLENFTFSSRSKSRVVGK